ncbi:MAG: hypothetical protein EOP10_16995 [Proteobacteria bacterium]|nr:MAG: hypothetical protein EOP10_16995 [Pseudomonadota bacterium]
MKSIFFLTGLLVFPMAASAKTFTFTTNRDDFKVGDWKYRELATNLQLPGCQGWDILQGSGWFPMTWHDEYSPSVNGNVYTFETKNSLARKYCNAKMDEYTALRIYLGSGDGDAAPMRGYIALNPDGTESEISVQCRYKVVPGDSYTIWCDEAHVLVGEEPVVVHLEFIED